MINGSNMINGMKFNTKQKKATGLWDPLLSLSADADVGEDTSEVTIESGFVVGHLIVQLNDFRPESQIGR